MTSGKAIRRIAMGMAKKLTAIRRDLHMYPELAFQEKRTAGKVAALLEGKTILKTIVVPGRLVNFVVK